MTATLTHPRPVLVDTASGLAVLAPRRRDALLARVRGDALDTRLSAGAAPEASRLLATRAAQLTAPRARQTLADRWDELVTRAARPATPYGPHVPPARRQVRTARPQIEQLAAALRGPRPVSAAGAAAARLLLTHGGSPVYDRRAAGDALATAVQRVLVLL